MEVSAVSHFAVLIGIDAYHEKPLRGPVRDVQGIQQFLKTALPTAHIQTLVAPLEGGETFSSEEQPAQLPTYRNVIEAFKTVTDAAKKGDCLYVHFSGHGTREKPERQYSNQNTGDLALGLLDDAGNTRLLPGYILAFELKRMVDMGMVVTLVLDCCFSGTPYRRGNPSARYLPQHGEMEIDARTNGTDRLPNDVVVSGEWRDASMRPNWLVNPDGYAILAACGPHDEAVGLTRENGEKYGALSYLLLQALKRHGATLNIGSLCDYLRVRFWDSEVKQNPVLYGNKTQAFFGGERRNLGIPSAPIRVKPDGTLELRAGNAHGLCESDRLLLQPLEQEGVDTRSMRVSAVAVNVKALSSELEVQGTDCPAICSGWFAVPLTRRCLETVALQLDAGVRGNRKLVAALRDASLAFDNDCIAPSCLYLRLGENKEYDVCEMTSSGAQSLPNLPRVMSSETGVDDISAVLEHPAMFRFVRDLHCPSGNGALNDLCVACIIDHQGDHFPPSDRGIQVPHGAKVTLVVENKGEQDLYVSVYDMGPRWQITGLLKASYGVLPAQALERNWEKGITMKVSEDMLDAREYKCHDIIKVIVTCVPTSFELLELPKLSTQRPHTLTTRKGNKRDGSSDIGVDGRFADQWAAFNFRICTVFEDPGLSSAT